MRGIHRSGRPLRDLLRGVVGAALLGAGPVMIVEGVRGRRQIRDELAAQQITFPWEEGLPDRLAALAGRRVETGPQARAYSELIKIHLQQATGGRTYAQISAEMAAGKGDEKLANLQQTAFMGEMLRAGLLSSYQAWRLTSLVTGLGALLSGLGAVVLAGDRSGRG